MTLQWTPRGGSPIRAFKEFRLADGTVIGIFQGSRGQAPDLDIVVKYRDRFTKGNRLRTPKHIHWVIDLLLKKEHNRQLTLQYLDYLVEVYDAIHPFTCKDDQQRCVLQYSVPERLLPFRELDSYGQYSIEFLTHVMELLSIEEKTGFTGAFMFKAVLLALRQEKDIFAVVAVATHTGR